MTVAALLVARPIFQNSRRVAAAGGTVYAAQLKEIDREEALGLLPTEDAQLARLEIKRRLASTEIETTSPEDVEMRRSDQFTLAGVVATIVLGSAVLYSFVGAPDAPSSPHSPQARTVRKASAAPSGMTLSPSSTSTNNSVAPVDEMMVRLEDKLALNPDDVEGWRMLGWSRFRTGDVEGARQAYKKAVELDATDADTLSAYGEALIRVAGGRISEEASSVLESTLAINPNDARARFLLGLKKEQDGNPEAALDDWISLLASSSPGDAWRNDVHSRIEELADQLGIDVTDRLPADLRNHPSAPTATQIEASASMSDDERQTMIEGMVSRLDQRLKESPDDLDGWLRLIRARRVLGQTDEADSALRRAQSEFSKDADALASLEEAATVPLED